MSEDKQPAARPRSEPKVVDLVELPAAAIHASLAVTRRIPAAWSNGMVELGYAVDPAGDRPDERRRDAVAGVCGPSGVRGDIGPEEGAPL